MALDQSGSVTEPTADSIGVTTVVEVGETSCRDFLTGSQLDTLPANLER